MSTLNVNDDTGIPPRYILFASEFSWFATANERIADYDRVAYCIEKAKEVGLPFTLIIDRHDPRAPIFLDSAAGYEPIELY